jgi:DNA-binding transcriptional ArsR family regulator
MERARTELIREFILDQTRANPRGVARRVAQAYGISRQAANRHLDLLVEAGLLEQSGQTRAREYRLRVNSSLARELRVTPVLNPDRVWEDHIAPVLAHDRTSVRDLCRGAFGELVRNAAQHSGAAWITFSFTNNARDITITVADDGLGIFSGLQRMLGAASPREAAEKIASLARVRAVDAPTARLALLARNFHTFTIESGAAVVRFDRATDTWSVTDRPTLQPGTAVGFCLRRDIGSAASASRLERQTSSI